MSQPIHETIKPTIKAAPERFELAWEMIETLSRADVSSKGTLWAEVVGTWNLSNHRNNMATALEIILQCRTFSPGVFERDENGRWRRAGKNPKHANTEGC